MDCTKPLDEGGIVLGCMSARWSIHEEKDHTLKLVQTQKQPKGLGWGSSLEWSLSTVSMEIRVWSVLIENMNRAQNDLYWIANPIQAFLSTVQLLEWNIR